MSYAAPSDMVARFGKPELIRLTTDDRTATEPETARIETALADATSFINDYLRKRYQTPIAAPPESVTRAACVLARYDLAQGENVDPTEEMRLARKDVVRWLEGIAGGTVTLDAPGLGGPASTSAGARVSDRSRPFSSDSQRYW